MFDSDSFDSGSFSPDSFLFDVVVQTLREIEVDFGRSYVSPKVRKIINRTAKKAASKERQKEYAQSLRNEPSSDYFASLLKVELAKEQITPTRLYEVLLGQQIDNQVSAQIRRYLELLGVYERIAQEEDEERALMMLMMEL